MIDIVFDGPPGPMAGRFVEVESPPGTSIRFGEWIERENGYWALRIPAPAPTEVEAKPLPNCPNCQGTGWVCEHHPAQVWLDGENCCSGAGKLCNCVAEFYPKRSEPKFGMMVDALKEVNADLCKLPDAASREQLDEAVNSAIDKTAEAIKATAPPSDTVEVSGWHEEQCLALQEIQNAVDQASSMMENAGSADDDTAPYERNLRTWLWIRSNIANLPAPEPDVGGEPDFWMNLADYAIVSRDHVASVTLFGPEGMRDHPNPDNLVSLYLKAPEPTTEEGWKEKFFDADCTLHTILGLIERAGNMSPEIQKEIDAYAKR